MKKLGQAHKKKESFNLHLWVCLIRIEERKYLYTVSMLGKTLELLCWWGPLTLFKPLHSRSWTECLEESEKQKSGEVNYLQRCGLALQFDWKPHLPCLVNQIADLSLSGTFLYLLPAGVVRIGRSGVTTEDQQPDIALSGPLVQSHHWYDWWIESSLIY